MANSWMDLIYLEEDDLHAEPYGESTSSPVFSYAYDSRVCNPCFPFSDSDSDSGLRWFFDPRPDLNRCFVDFVDRESFEFGMAEEFHPDSGLGPSGVGDLNLLGFEDEREEELGLALGSRSGSGSESRRQGGDSGPGLGVIAIDSDSDYEIGVFDLNSSANGNWDDNSGRVEGESGVPTSWNSLFGEETLGIDELLNWQEVQNAIQSADGDPEWRVLLPDNNLVSYSEHAEGIAQDYNLHLAASGVYDAAFDQMFDSESVIRGSPPASKRVVEDLPVVELTIEELGQRDSICAVCKDEIALEESVRRLPCSHYYHGECIIPWLGIRNTCPVCRYELPTDDPEYERNRRRQRGAGGLSN